MKDSEGISIGQKMLEFAAGKFLNGVASHSMVDRFF